MRCCLLGCQHTKDTYAVSQAQRPWTWHKHSPGGVPLAENFWNFFEVRSGPPSKFPHGGPVSQKFYKSKNPNKIKKNWGQIWTSQQISWWGGSLRITCHRQTCTDNTSHLRATNKQNLRPNEQKTQYHWLIMAPSVIRVNGTEFLVVVTWSQSPFWIWTHPTWFWAGGQLGLTLSTRVDTPKLGLFCQLFGRWVVSPEPLDQI